jgi:hypothetical protein
MGTRPENVAPKPSIASFGDAWKGHQNLHYDFWWNLPRDYMVTSEWALPLSGGGERNPAKRPPTGRHDQRLPP